MPASATMSGATWTSSSVIAVTNSSMPRVTWKRKEILRQLDAGLRWAQAQVGARSRELRDEGTA